MRKLLVLGVAMAFSVAGTGCKQLGIGGEEKKEEAAAAPTDEAKKAEEAAKAAQAEAQKKADEALKQAEEAKKKAAEDAAKAVDLAKAEADKAKAEAQAEVEKAKAAAEEEKARIEEKAAREALTRDLAGITGELQTAKTGAAQALAAWQAAADETKTANLAGLVKELDEFETERAAVEGLMVQGKLDEARTKLEVLKAKFPSLKEKTTTLTADKPVDPAQWEAMIKMLAEETCLIKKNLPAQDFQVQREALFQKYGLDRVVYETLRADYNRAPKPEDQAKLGTLVSELCPEPVAPADGTAPADAAKPADAAAPADAAKPADGTVPADAAKPADATAPADAAKPAEVKPEDKKVGPTGIYAGTLVGTGVKSSIKFDVKGGKLSGATATLAGTAIKLTGAFSNDFLLTGKGGGDHLKCRGKVTDTFISGSCEGTANNKRFEKASFTAKRTK
jgi:hypothetical protein